MFYVKLHKKLVLMANVASDTERFPYRSEPLTSETETEFSVFHLQNTQSHKLQAHNIHF